MTEVYCVMISPIGLIRIVEKNEAIHSLQFTEGIPLVDPSTPLLKRATQQISAYFAGERKSFDLPLHPEGTDFQRKVWNLLQEIPFGKSETYLQLSKRLGDLKAIRAVAAANGKNPIPLLIPCHRVIGSDGSLTGYLGGIDKKRRLLVHEGVPAVPLSLFD